MEVNHLTTNSTVHLLQNGINNRVNLCNRSPKMWRVLIVVAYRKCSLTRVELQEIFNKEKSRCIYFLEWMYCMQFLGYNNVNPCCFLKFPHSLSNHNTYPGGVLRISSDRDDRKQTKIKTQKNPYGFWQNPKKSVDQKLTSQKSHAEFPSLRWNVMHLILKQLQKSPKSSYT